MIIKHSLLIVSFHFKRKRPKARYFCSDLNIADLQVRYPWAFACRSCYTAGKQEETGRTETNKGRSDRKSEEILSSFRVEIKGRQIHTIKKSAPYFFHIVAVFSPISR